MIALHAGFAAHRLLFWVEPGASTKQLRECMALLGVELPRGRAAIAEATAWLPHREQRMAPSSPLMEGGAEPGADSGECALAAFAIDVVPLAFADAATMLASCANRTIAAPGVLIGADLAYWRHAILFAAALVRRGQYLPSLVERDDQFHAMWAPLIAGADGARLAALAAAMPPAARALTLDESGEPPTRAAESCLRDFVAFAVDGIVRGAGSTAGGIGHSVHERWMAALRSESSVLLGPAEEARDLMAQAARWSRPARVAAEAGSRLAFRLEEPTEQGAPWSVRYLLQGTKDPSLILPLREAWTPSKAMLKALGQDGGALREHMLVSLSQAAALCPPVEESLKQSEPDLFQGDGSAAHSFLRDSAPLLEGAGFGVMLPGWWSRQGSAVGIRVRAEVKRARGEESGAGLTLDSILEFNWKLALGGEQITLRELDALARLKEPLVQVRGQWVEVDAAAIARAVELMKKQAAGKATMRDVVQMAVGGGSIAGLEIEGVTAKGAVGELLDRITGTAAASDLAPPAGLQATLRPYQTRGFSWLDGLSALGFGACLADDMGLGKTIQTLALVQRRREAGETRPVLLVCPTSVAGNWRKEAERFTPDLSVMVHHGASRVRGGKFLDEAREQGMVVSTYSLLHRDQEHFREIDWAGVILDEAQNIKNADTLSARAARSLRSDYRVALTGTPVENNVGDLWSIMEFLNPGFLGNQADFRRRYLLPIQIYRSEDAAKRLRRLTAPFVLRRMKTDKSIISDLPDKIETKVFCTLTREQASLYKAVASDAQKAIERAEGIERRGIVLATLLKLKQVCNHPAQFLKDNSALGGRSGKLARFTEMVDELLAAGDRALVFTQFTDMGEILRRWLTEAFGVEVLYLHGGTSKKQRDEMVEQFQGTGGPRLFLLSLKAGGTGLNLTAANHVFHFDRWWNPAVENQATDRAFRIGQKRKVQVHKFVCGGTLEEKIDEMIERKREIAGSVVSAGETWITEMSNKELRDLFALSADAVGD